MISLCCRLSAWPDAHFSARVLSPHNLNCPQQLPGAFYQRVCIQKNHFKYQNFFYLWDFFSPPTSWKPHLSPLLALCVFLVCERHRGEASDWFPYIDVLPTSYTCPAYFTDEVMAVLPPCVQRKAREQQEAVWEIHSSNQDFFRCVSHKTAFQWLLSSETEVCAVRGGTSGGKGKGWTAPGN